jgi:hypothetical protein
MMKALATWSPEPYLNVTAVEREASCWLVTVCSRERACCPVCGVQLRSRHSAARSRTLGELAPGWGCEASRLICLCLMGLDNCVSRKLLSLLVPAGQTVTKVTPPHLSLAPASHPPRRPLRNSHRLLSRFRITANVSNHVERRPVRYNGRCSAHRRVPHHVVAPAALGLVDPGIG